MKKAVLWLDDLRKLWRIVWTATGRWTLVWATLLVLLGALPVIGVMLTKPLVDNVTLVLKGAGSWEKVKFLLLIGVGMALVAILSDVGQGVLEWVRTSQTELIQDHISLLIQQKSAEVDLSFYESPGYFDSLYRARENAHLRVLGLLEHLGGAIQNTLSLLLMTFIVIVYHPILLLALFASVIPAFMIVARYNWLTRQWWLSTTVERRWIQYYDQKLTTASPAAEIRLYRLGERFCRRCQELRHQLRVSHLKLIKRQNIARLWGTLLGVVSSGLSIGWVGRQTLLGKATLGDLVLFYQAFLGSQGFMRMLTLNLGQVYNNSLFLSDLFKFLDLKPSITDPKKPVSAPTKIETGIEFNEVTFRYPGSERAAVSGLNMFIPAGKIVAIVGPNGAGKSTLIKLLSRFYDPESGSIVLDGVDVRDMSLPDLRSMLTILFQLPVNYDASAATNISISDLAGTATISEIRKAAERSGADEVITRLPDAYDTLLGKSFEHGTELSAGEWQRIGMARAFLRRAPVILLDEPTSFMDSWAEFDWFERLRLLAKGRTAMVITHRFTIAMRADLIHVMQDGQLVESGTHRELLEQNGLYARSWRDQMAAISDSGLALVEPTAVI